MCLRPMAIHPKAGTSPDTTFPCKGGKFVAAEDKYEPLDVNQVREALEIHTRLLPRHWTGQQVREYLRARGLADQDARKAGIDA